MSQSSLSETAITIWPSPMSRGMPQSSSLSHISSSHSAADPPIPQKSCFAHAPTRRALRTGRCSRGSGPRRTRKARARATRAFGALQAPCPRGSRWERPRAPSTSASQAAGERSRASYLQGQHLCFTRFIIRMGCGSFFGPFRKAKRIENHLPSLDKALAACTLVSKGRVQEKIPLPEVLLLIWWEEYCRVWVHEGGPKKRVYAGRKEGTR